MVSKNYYREGGGKDYYEKNKDKIKETSRKRYEANKEELKLKFRERKLRNRYGLTPDDYKTMLLAQDYKCMICAKTSEKNLDVDHCHETGKVRELLCNNCNRGIGYLQDDPLILENALAYLKRHKPWLAHW